jgi:SPP1 gp7 family putative phage head morphogenesis protein
MTGPSPEISKEVLAQRAELIDVYIAAQRRLEKSLTSALLTDFRRFRIQEQLVQVNAIIAALNKEVKASLPGVVEAYYGHGADLANAALRAQDVSVSALNLGNRIHTAAVQAIAQQMAQDLAKANLTMRDTAVRILRQTQQIVVEERQINQIIAQGVVTGETRRETSARLREALAKEIGSGNLVQAGGRRFTPEYYAELVTRTRTREAVTQGAITRSMEFGITLFQVSIHDNPCPRCAQFQGKVYSIVPNAGFPMLEFRPPFHPHCRHVVLPYVPVPGREDRHEALRVLSNSKAPITGGLPGYEEAVAQARKTGGLKKKQLQGETRTKPNDMLASPSIGPIGKVKVSDAIPVSAYSRLSTELGDGWTLIDATLTKVEAEVIKEHVGGLSILPDGVLRKLRGEGLNRIQIGKGGVANFPGYEEYRGIQIPGAPKGTTWDDSRGAYVPSRKDIVLGTGSYGYEGTALHEVGHALGDVLGYESDARAGREYLAQANGILGTRREYYPGGRPTERGKKEFFAESVAFVIMNQTKAERLFSSNYLRFILEVVLAQ